MRKPVIFAGVLVILSMLLEGCGMAGFQNATPTPLTSMRPNDDMLMVYVPAGAFSMGGDSGAALRECQRASSLCEPDVFKSEEPAHSVTLKAFWIDQTEVTNGKYAQCVQGGACQPPADVRSRSWGDYYNSPMFAEYPVLNVDWNQASAYCAWAGARLPTEAEWEKAARGTDGRLYPWGMTLNPDLANYDEQFMDPKPVGSYPGGASPYGALDMAGNVSEWVADWYGETYYAESPANDPHGPASGTLRVARGGSWYDFPVHLRSIDRNRYEPTHTNFGIGFRCAR